jgi:large subunit ribosomal protein L10
MKVESELREGTATLFLYGDPVMPLKALAKIIKELSLPVIKFGILDGSSITSEQIMKLSTLPSKETLLTQLVVGLKSPISGLHRALNWNLQKFVMTLKAIEKTKGVN